MPLVNLTTPDAIGDVEQCVVITWLKREGDEVEIGETILELQAAKVAFDVPSPVTGRLVDILAKQGDVVNWGQVLAHLEVSEPAFAGDDSNPTPETSIDRNHVAASPLAVRVAADKGIDFSKLKGSGSNGRITEKDVYSYIADLEKPVLQDVPVSPAAKRLAREYKLDLSKITGTGAGGRVNEGDVQAYLDQKAGLAKDTGVSPKATGATEIPVVGMRAIIAQRMLTSVQTTAQLTLHTEVDVSALVARHPLDKQKSITYTDHIMWACAQALRSHPLINAIVDGMTIRVNPQINIGLAVSLEEGLIVPVIFNAGQLTLEEIARQRVLMVEKARTGKLMPPEYTGGTFTVTNLGTYEIDAFTPILNPPELAILGVGRIVEKVVIYQGKISQRHMLTLSLTIDHRIIDGAPGAAFLKTVKHWLETDSAA